MLFAVIWEGTCTSLINLHMHNTKAYGADWLLLDLYQLTG